MRSGRFPVQSSFGMRLSAGGAALALAAGLATLHSGCRPLMKSLHLPSTAPPASGVYTLDNGLAVLIHEDHFAPVVALQVWVQAGGADESEQEAGVAHVHEHMLFKGTTHRGLGDIASAVESAGGRINAWTSWDETVYHIVLASRYADLGLDVLADAVQNSTFDPKELKKELAVVLEEWKRGQDHPGSRLFNTLFATAFHRHPYHRPVIGTRASIEALTRDKVLDFFRRFYTPNNMTLVIVGDVDTKHTREVVARLFGHFEAHPIPRPARAVEPPQEGLRFATIRMQVKEAHTALGFHIPAARDEDAPLLDLLAFVLGGGESSRLYRRLVATEELATDVGAFAYTPPEPGLFVVTAALEASQLERAYAAAIEELARVRRKIVGTEELARAKANLESEFLFRKETVQGQARELGYFLTVYGDPDYDRRYLARVERATGEDLLRVARHYLRRDNLSVVTLLPRGAESKLDAERAALLAALVAEQGPALAGNARPSEKKLAAQERAKPATTQQAASSEPKLLELANGVRLIVREHHDVPLLSIRAAMLGGVLAETPKDNGISNFVAEMLTRGTLKTDRAEMARRIEAVAGSLSGFSGRNSLGVAGSFPAAHTEEAVKMFLEVLLEPSFEPGEVEKTRRELLLAIKNRADDAAHTAFDLGLHTVYPHHPYGMTTLGEQYSVAKTSREDLVAFYARALHPENLVVAIVGDIDTDKILQLLRPALGSIGPAAKPFVVPPVAPKPVAVRRAHLDTDRHQTHIFIGYPSVDVRDPDRYPLEVLDNILSGQSGRLFYELRDRRSLAYTVTAFFTKGLTPGVFGAYIATDPANTDKALAGLLDELAKVAREEVEESELERARRYLIGVRAISLQTNGALAEDMAFNELYGLGFRAGDEYAEKILAVRAEDVRRVAQRYLAPSTRAEAIVGPSHGSSANKASGS